MNLPTIQHRWASPRMAFAIVQIALGIFLISKGLGKVGWLTDPARLSGRLSHWAVDQTHASISRSYAAALVPGAPVFARLVPFGEVGAGLAMIFGVWTRPAATLAALMILNFHLATGQLLTREFITDANGLFAVAALVAMAIHGDRKSA